MPQPEEYICLEPERLERFLDRGRAKPHFTLELNLAENLVEILRKANEFVPSAAGSILLDNPLVKWESREKGNLTFIAAFGDKAEALLGRSIPASAGIAGHVYLTGETYTCSDASTDQRFYQDVDQELDHVTQSLIAIPVRIEKEVCGVVELINRNGAAHYSQEDHNLLEIFAGYISVSIQNVLDGRQAQEIAKRDNLTGLFNDRYLHIGLSRAIEKAQSQEDGDLTVLFIDLDYFKQVNDTHGHLAGSQVLREFGQLLRHELNDERIIAARYGGDEFVVVIPDHDLTAGVDFAERLRVSLTRKTFCHKPGEIQPDPINLNGITCSIGVASLRRHLGDQETIERTKSTLLRLADSAMYVAKETGRNRTAVAGEPVRRRF